MEHKCDAFYCCRRKASIKAKKISKPKPPEVYVASSDYRKQEKGEVNLDVGMYVEVLEKSETGRSKVNLWKFNKGQ